MKSSKKISVEQCCIYYEVETSFVQQLDEYGLIELIRSGKESYLAFEQLPRFEKFRRLHYELDINIAGLDAIHHLINRIEHLQQKIKNIENAISAQSQMKAERHSVQKKTNHKK
ncbi:hypothetical protein QFZ51_003319 [Chitinophaga sp. W3I9]|uniref:chaperone modulator CbpM n=1 Tax=unclassified Chitinophaga TaxID=2619133 RepID=UPI003D1A7A4B